MDIDSNNKRIVHNAALLVGRLAVNTVIGVITWRIVLEQLGVEDYGIYSVVVAIMVSLTWISNAAVGASTQFISSHVEKDDTAALLRACSSALALHLIVAVVVIVISETAGMWFLNHQLSIPPGRLRAANIVLQLAMALIVTQILQGAFISVIMGHERMGIIAKTGIAGDLLKLAWVWSLKYVSCDKMVMYAEIILAINIIICAVYAWYCAWQFKFNPLTIKPLKSALISMLKFTMHHLFGNFSITATSQGIVFLINITFGVIVNAAVAIANTATTIVSGISGAVLQSFTPRVMKNYAAGDISQMSRLMRHTLVATSAVYAVLSVPCFVLATDVLAVWLGEAPPHAPAFLRVTLVTGAVMTSLFTSNVAIQATGNIKRISYINGTVLLATLVIAWWAYHAGCNETTAYLINTVTGVSACLLTCRYIRIQIRLFNILPYTITMLLTWVIYGITAAGCYAIATQISCAALRIAIIAPLSVASVTLMYQVTGMLPLKQLVRLFKVPTT